MAEQDEPQKPQFEFFTTGIPNEKPIDPPSARKVTPSPELENSFRRAADETKAGMEEVSRQMRRRMGDEWHAETQRKHFADLFRHRDPMAEIEEQSRQSKLYALRIHELVAWAYADKTRRRGPFDAFGWADGDHKVVTGVALEAIKQGLFEFVGNDALKLPEDHEKEASRRNARYRSLPHRKKQGDEAYTIRFTVEGLKRARSAWRDTHLPLWKRMRSISPRAKIVALLIFGALGWVSSFFGGAKESWKFISNPVGYFHDDTPPTNQPAVSPALPQSNPIPAGGTTAPSP